MNQEPTHNDTATQASAQQQPPKTLGRRIADKFMYGSGIFTFLRASVSSQIASWTDMGVCFVFYSWILVAMGVTPLRSFLATSIGLVAGGVVNCCINYKFTFRAENCSVKAVALKYLLIWIGNFILNVGGTTLLTHLLNQIQWQDMHLPFGIVIKPDGVFIAARLVVSLIVSLAWNYLMQKNFVYRPTRFDPIAIRIIDTITFRRTTRC